MKRIIMVMTIIIFMCSVYVEGNDETKRLKLFFIEITTQGCEDIDSDYYVYDVATGEKRMKFSEEQLPSSGPPIISNDGRFFAYCFEENGQDHMRLLDVNNNMLIINKQVPFITYEIDFFKDYIAISGNTGRSIESREMYLININTMELERITNNNVSDYNPVISPDNDGLLFLQLNKENTQTYLMKYDFNSKEVDKVNTFDGTKYGLFQWLNNNRALLVKRGAGIPFVFDLKTGVTTKISLDRIYSIKVSPDEKKMVYLRIRETEPRLDLYITDIDGSNVEKLTVADNIDIIAPQWFME